MDFILPTPITDAMLTSSTVPETDYGEWSALTFANLSDESATKWRGICAAPNGNVYACAYDGDIYMQTAGAGDFNALSQTSRTWQGMCAASNGNIYACTYDGDIYMQTAGTGNFAALSQTSRNWRAMCAAPNGNIYACVWSGDIYMQTAGTGNFTALSQTTRYWNGMCATSNGNIYASAYNGDIYLQTGGEGSFAALSQTTRHWQGMCADANSNIFAGVFDGGVYVRTAGAGNFNTLSQTTRFWAGFCAAPDGDIYACAYNTDDTHNRIYFCSGTYIYSDGDHAIVTTGDHKIYESLTDNNFNHDPTTDATNWLEVSATNRWACFDGTIGNQTSQATSIQYVLAPGAIDSIALLNLDADSVRVQLSGTGGPENLITEDSNSLITEDSNQLTTEGATAYDVTTDTTNKTDLVLTDLTQDATATLTITISKTTTAKVGEIIVGNKTYIGSLQYSPSIGIKDWSTKEVDVYGHYTITERTFSKWMKCALTVLMANLDTLALNLATYRSTPLVWVGSETYSSMILYGYYTDFSIVLSYPAYAICQLEIEGLT